MSEKPKTKRRKAPAKVEDKIDSSFEVVRLQNTVDGLTELVANLSGRVQQQDNRINQNWTRFVFHDHRRVDLSGPQFFNTDYEKQFVLQQKAQADARAKARGEQEPPQPTPPPRPTAEPVKTKDPPASEK